MAKGALYGQKGTFSKGPPLQLLTLLIKDEGAGSDYLTQKRHELWPDCFDDEIYDEKKMSE